MSYALVLKKMPMFLLVTLKARFILPVNANVEDKAESTGSTTEDRIPVGAGSVNGLVYAGAGSTTEEGH